MRKSAFIVVLRLYIPMLFVFLRHISDSITLNNLQIDSFV